MLETSNGNPALHETFRNRLVYNQRFLKMSVVTLLLSPSLGRGDGLLIPLLPPSSGRRWRVAPEVGFALFRLRPTPALRASPFHGKGVDGLLIPLLPPSRGRRENAASQTSHEEGLRYENTAPPHSSFRAKARNLFRSRSGKKRKGSG